jgi:bacterioferritin
MEESKTKLRERLVVLMMGPITSEYQANAKDLIDKLNVLRSTEIVAHLQYKHHAYMAVSMLLPGVKQEFLEHAQAEEKHADMLGERIQQLGGIPVFKPEEIGAEARCQHVEAAEAPTLEGMIAEDLEVERAQIKAYTKLIREVGFTDPTTRRVLEDVLQETERHASELRDLLSRRSPVEEPPAARS